MGSRKNYHRQVGTAEKRILWKKWKLLLDCHQPLKDYLPNPSQTVSKFARETFIEKSKISNRCLRAFSLNSCWLSYGNWTNVSSGSSPASRLNGLWNFFLLNFIHTSFIVLITWMKQWIVAKFLAFEFATCRTIRKMND